MHAHTHSIAPRLYIDVGPVDAILILFYLQAVMLTGATPWPASSSAAAHTTGSAERRRLWRLTCAAAAACSCLR
jgi:hypothetical protein